MIPNNYCNITESTGYENKEGKDIGNAECSSLLDRDYINSVVKSAGTNDEDILKLEFGKIYKAGVFVPPDCTFKDSSFFI